jgi:uncharacterized protein YicC (UPF0701 family)
MARVEALRTLAGQAAPLVPQAVQRMQARFIERWQEALGTAGSTSAARLADAATSAPGVTVVAGVTGVAQEAAEERALQEAAAYALRIDVAEELSRLAVHLDETERLLQHGGELGKRLDFLIQELHREANTLGSKAATHELSTISMDMRVLIEQMREQVQNIE